jgi:methionyl-tRNA synthetase
MIEPYMPASAAKIASFFGLSICKDGLSWDDIGKDQGLSTVLRPEVLFLKLEDEQIDVLREKYSGSQHDRADKADEKEENVKDFTNTLDLRVAKVIKIERHPKADKLYVINLDIAGEERVIVSGLVDHYAEEDLLNKHIIAAYNLKPAKLRGIESRGMLLAAEDKDENGRERVEALFVGDAPTGTRVTLEGVDVANLPSEMAEIDINTFFSIPIEVKDNRVVSEGRAVTVNGEPVNTKIIALGKVC